LMSGRTAITYTQAPYDVAYLEALQAFDEQEK
jgi:hypothetical protein